MDHPAVFLAQILGPLLATGAGTYFGLKGAINGIRERSARMEKSLGEVRDFARDGHHLIPEFKEAARQLGRLHEELNR